MPDLDLQISVAVDHGFTRRKWGDRELRLGEISRRLAKDLIRLPEFSVLTLSAFRRSAISLATPPRTPLSIFAFLTHSLRDRAVQPIFTAIEVTVAPAREDPLVIENQPNDARPHFG